MSPIIKKLLLVPLMEGIKELVISKAAKDDNKEKLSTKAKYPAGATAGVTSYLYLFDGLPAEYQVIASAVVSVVTTLAFHYFRWVEIK